MDWMPLSTAPRDGTEVLVCWESREVVTFGSCMDSSKRTRDGMPTIAHDWPVMWGSYPTHWMPKPPAKGTTLSDAAAKARGSDAPPTQKISFA